MVTEDEWAERVSRFLKAELKRRGVTYEQLAERLRKMGAEETVASIKGKLTRGRFTAIFMMQVLKAIGCPTVRVDDV